MSKEPVELVGIGNAIVDVLSQTEDDFLKQNNLRKGSMMLIEADQAESLYAKMGPALEMSGGSVANTIAAFAAMGGKGGYIGKVANDQLGRVFQHDLRAMKVAFDTPPLTEGAPTARCLILVTPDAQRTMCTFLGACVWISPSDLNEEMIKTAQVTYLEGYLFDKPRAKQTFRKAGEIAHAAGKKVALSLSDSFCVERHRQEFLDFIRGQVDILFANEQEILSLYQTEDFEEAVFYARKECDLVALTRGAKGSLLVTSDQSYEIAAEPVSTVVDTTGAGDFYAAGLLYGFIRNKPLVECGRIASISAASVLPYMGARPQGSLLKVLEKKQAV